MAQRVLVADDDQQLLDVLASAIEEGGREAVKARDGAELIQAISENDFDLIITDISMPWMTGLQVGTSARYAGLRTPLLVITALRDPELETQVASLGQRARLLRKPLQLETLERAIEDLLAAPAPELAPAAPAP